ncbi:MAG: potassium channel family protein [Thermoleophilia bacterium]|nr:potassium channel family protein [Gaiellaceae bacterium]MDW8338614.1 potassium channel family protein [Thermoleophilia bacterium]
MLRAESRWIERAVGSNRILLSLAGLTVALSTVAGVLMRWIDPEAFPTVGTGIWWAVVTFTTVGYGDYVPTDALGRLVAGIVMVFAITFISIVTAIVTSVLVTQAQRRREGAQAAHEAALDPRLDERLGSIEERLERIERALAQR